MWRWIALASLVACRQGELAYLAPPPLEAETLIVAVSDGVRPPQITAAAKDRLELVLEAPETEEVEVAVVGLPERLEELGLKEGTIPTQDGLPLERFERTGVALATWRPDGWSGWSAVDALPEVFAEVRLPRAGCSSPVDRVVQVIGFGLLVPLAVPLDDQRMLLVVDDRVLVWSPLQGILQSEALPRTFAGSFVDAARGRAYLGAAEGSALYTLDLATREATFTASVAEPFAFGWTGLIDGITDGSDPFLVALASGGYLLRLEAGRYEIVSKLTIEGAHNADSGGVLVRSRTEVLVGGDHHPTLERFDGDVVRPELDGVVGAKGFAALAEVPELGPIAVELSSGVIFARPADVWATIGTTFAEAHLALVLGPRHFILSDGFGRWNEYHPRLGVDCGIVQSSQLNEARAIFRLGRAIYGVGPGAGGMEIVHLADLP